MAVVERRHQRIVYVGDASFGPVLAEDGTDVCVAPPEYPARESLTTVGEITQV